MFQRTSTTFAPWTVVPGNDKKYGRVFFLEQCIEQLQRGLERKLSPLRRFKRTQDQ